jgi:hypothetical protein
VPRLTTGGAPLAFAGTIRKIQHAAISHDRQQILHGAARAQASAKKVKSAPPSAGGEALDAAEEDEVEGAVAAELAESEKAIMQIEA